MRHISFALTTAPSQAATPSLSSVRATCRALWQFEHTNSHLRASRHRRSQFALFSNLPMPRSLSLFTWSNSSAAKHALNPQSMHLPPIWSTSFFLIAARSCLCLMRRAIWLILYRVRRSAFIFSLFTRTHLRRFSFTRSGLFLIHRWHAAFAFSGFAFLQSRNFSRYSSMLARRCFLTAARALSGFCARHFLWRSVAARRFSSGAFTGDSSI